MQFGQVSYFTIYNHSMILAEWHRLICPALKKKKLKVLLQRNLKPIKYVKLQFFYFQGELTVKTAC